MLAHRVLGAQAPVALDVGFAQRLGDDGLDAHVVEHARAPFEPERPEPRDEPQPAANEAVDRIAAHETHGGDHPREHPRRRPGAHYQGGTLANGARQSVGYVSGGHLHVGG